MGFLCCGFELLLERKRFCAERSLEVEDLQNDVVYRNSAEMQGVREDSVPCGASLS